LSECLYSRNARCRCAGVAAMAVLRLKRKREEQPGPDSVGSLLLFLSRVHSGCEGERPSRVSVQLLSRNPLPASANPSSTHSRASPLTLLRPAASSSALSAARQTATLLPPARQRSTSILRVLQTPHPPLSAVSRPKCQRVSSCTLTPTRTRAPLILLGDALLWTTMRSSIVPAASLTEEARRCTTCTSKTTH